MNNDEKTKPTKLSDFEDRHNNLKRRLLKVLVIPRSFNLS